jgi:O-antigen ligase
MALLVVLAVFAWMVATEARAGSVPPAGLALAVWIGWAVIPVLSVSTRGDRWSFSGVKAVRDGWGFAMIALLYLVYGFNATHRWVETSGLLPVRHWNGWPGSAYPEGTLVSFWHVLAGMGLMHVCRNLDVRDLRRFMLAVVAGGGVMAIMVIGQRIVPKPHPIYDVTGIFVYENHYAAFANLIIPAALVLATRAQISAFQKGKPSNPSGLYFLVAALLAVSVVVSRSRAGVVVTGLIVCAYALWRWRLRRRYPFLHPPSARLATTLTLSAAMVSLAVALVVLAGQWDRWDTLVHELNYRRQMIADTWSMFAAHPWWGTGPGSFAVVFPYYQSELLINRSFLHAHNEPLQFLAEFGALGAAVFLVGVCAAARASRGITDRRERLPAGEIEIAGMGLALAGIALHSLADFPLRHPLIGLMVFVYAGLLAAGRSASSAPTSGGHRPDARP